MAWRGIEATLQLAQSTNAKVVIIGSAKDGLPVILGNANIQAPRAPAMSPTDNDTISKEKAAAALPGSSQEKAPAAGRM
jgi:hypothetical protein